MEKQIAKSYLEEVGQKRKVSIAVKDRNQHNYGESERRKV